MNPRTLFPVLFLVLSPLSSPAAFANEVSVHLVGLAYTETDAYSNLEYQCQSWARNRGFAHYRLEHQGYSVHPASKIVSAPGNCSGSESPDSGSVTLIGYAFNVEDAFKNLEHQCQYWASERGHSTYSLVHQRTDTNGAVYAAIGRCS